MASLTRAEYQREWRKEHLEKVREYQRNYQREWRSSHREEIREQQRLHKQALRADPNFRAKERERIYAARLKNPEHHKELKRASWFRHKGTNNARQRARALELKREVLAAYGGFCSFCGKDDPTILTIDHLYEDGADHKRRESIKGSSEFYLWLKRAGFPPNEFHVLCFNCQVKKHRAFREYRDRTVQRSPALTYCQEFRRRVRREVLKAYGNRCAICGCTDPDCLSMDHIDESGAKQRIVLFGRRNPGSHAFYLWLKRNGFPKDNFQCLCMNCNVRKHWEAKNQLLPPAA